MVQTQKSPAVRRMLRLVLLAAAIGFGVKALILHPIFIQLDANIVYKYAWYTTVLYYLIDGGLIDLSVFAVCYPASLYAVWKEGIKGAKSVPIAFSLITLGKFLVNYIVNTVMDGALPDPDDFLADIPMILAMLALELIQYGLPILLLCLLKKRYDERVETSELRSELTETEAPAPVFPFARLVSFKNPLQLSALAYSLIVFLGLEIGYHIYQLTLMNLYGATDGWANMLINLLTDLVLGVVLYFVAILLFTRFFNKEQKES